MLRVLVADDNAVIRSGLVSLLEVGGHCRVVAEAATGAEAIRLAREHSPDIVLLDVRMPVMDGLDAVGPIAATAPVLMVTYSDEREVVAQAIRAGASGYLVHGRFTVDELQAAVRTVAEGNAVLSPAVVSTVVDALRGTPGSAAALPPAAAALTERERDIMRLLSEGASNGDIARTLFLAEKTVKNHLNRIYAKLGVANRTAAIAEWLGTAARRADPGK
jgi:DNA-binding NarL/FixJ family response regulator